MRIFNLKDLHLLSEIKRDGLRMDGKARVWQRVMFIWQSEAKEEKGGDVNFDCKLISHII